MRGEKQLVLGIDDYEIGSSPHARGKVAICRIFFTSNRIIPACAGKRPSLITALLFHQDHPRMRGEKSTFKN